MTSAGASESPRQAEEVFGEKGGSQRICSSPNHHEPVHHKPYATHTLCTQRSHCQYICWSTCKLLTQCTVSDVLYNNQIAIMDVHVS